MGSDDSEMTASAPGASLAAASRSREVDELVGRLQHAVGRELSNKAHTIEQHEHDYHEGNAILFGQCSRLLTVLADALRPFAEVADKDIGTDEADADIFRPMSAGNNRAPLLKVGDFRTASEAVNT